MKHLITLAITMALLAAIMPLAAVAATTPLQSLKERRVEVALNLKGTGSYQFKEMAASQLRNRILALGAAEVAITGPQFRAAAQTMDRTHQSGRYSAASKAQVPMGQWQAPTDRWEVSAVINLQSKSWNTSLRVARQNFTIRNYRVEVQTQMVAETIDLLTGLNGPGAQSSAQDSQTITSSVNGGILSAIGGFSKSTSGVDLDVFTKVYEQAMDALLAKIVVRPLAVEQLEVIDTIVTKAPTTSSKPAMVITGVAILTFPSGQQYRITIPTSKSLRQNMTLLVAVAGEEVGRFKVSTIDTTVNLTHISGQEPAQDGRIYQFYIP